MKNLIALVCVLLAGLALQAQETQQAQQDSQKESQQDNQKEGLPTGRQEFSSRMKLIEFGMDNQRVLTFKGKAAETLYAKLEKVEEQTMALDDEPEEKAKTWKIKMGKNIRCDKVELKDGKTIFECTTGLIDSDGAISGPAAG